MVRLALSMVEGVLVATGVCLGEAGHTYIGVVVASIAVGLAWAEGRHGWGEHNG